MQWLKLGPLPSDKTFVVLADLATFFHGSTPLWFAAELLLFTPVLVLAHELGHALIGLSRTEGLVRVEVGRQPSLIQGRVGRLVFALNPVPSRARFAGVARTFAKFSPRDRITYALAGPLGQATAALLFTLVGLDAGAHSLVLFGLVGLALTPFNFIPITHGKVRSDGLVALTAVRELRARRRQPPPDPETASFTAELDATHARWLVLYTDAGVVTQRRAQAFTAVAFFLGYPNDGSDPRVGSVRRLAHAGWCWREAEKRGDPRRLREAALDAVHRATVSGAVEPSLTVTAARSLLTSDIELGLASPGADDQTRVRFLASALQRMPLELRPPFLPRMEQMFAFRYGVAVREIERARAT